MFRNKVSKERQEHSLSSAMAMLVP
ncbi:hypothetical protein, partial [Bacillus subtilis]